MKKLLASLPAFLVVCAMCAGAPFAAASPLSFTFETLPVGGSIDGTAGSTIGWGYTLSNPSATDWLITLDLQADSFFDGTAQSLFFDPPILAPGASVTVAYDALSLSGLYELTWDLTAPVGAVNTGTFVVTAEWWDGDPFDGGTFIDFAPDATAAYSASVTAPPATDPVPEPSALLLLGGGLSAFYSKLRKSR